MVMQGGFRHFAHLKMFIVRSIVRAICIALNKVDIFESKGIWRGIDIIQVSTRWVSVLPTILQKMCLRGDFYETMVY
jgi:hypothetical protein